MIKLLIIGVLMFPLFVSAETPKFQSLKTDGYHDTNGPGFSKLQEPEEAMTGFPRRPNGVINWVEALDQGLITPRPSKTGEGKHTSIDLDIILEKTGSMPNVFFSHKVHTSILTCANCHVEIFIPKKGANFISMNSIMDGQHCGVCHGAVAFGIKDCTQCHSVDTKKGLR